MALSLSLIYAAMASEETVALRISTGVPTRFAVRQRAYFWQTDSCSNLQTGILQPFLVHCKFPCTHPWHELNMPVPLLERDGRCITTDLWRQRYSRFTLQQHAPTLATLAHAALWT